MSAEPLGGPPSGASCPPYSEAAASCADDSQNRLETRVGQTLRVGVRASTLFLVLGLFISLVSDAPVAQWLLSAGLVILMATPIARVAATVVEYASARDWTFFALTSIVLVELLAGIGAALVLHRRY